MPAIQSDPRFGPVFGSADAELDVGHDIFISTNSNRYYESYSSLGASFRHPTFLVGSKEANEFLAGKNKFKCLEIEVFQKEEATYEDESDNEEEKTETESETEKESD
jgi:hypothetical protein